MKVTDTTALAAALTSLSSAASSYNSVASTWAVLVAAQTAAAQAQIKPARAIEPTSVYAGKQRTGPSRIDQRALTADQAAQLLNTLAHTMDNIVQNTLKGLINGAFTNNLISFKTYQLFYAVAGDVSVVAGLEYASVGFVAFKSTLIGLQNLNDVIAFLGSFHTPPASISTASSTTSSSALPTSTSCPCLACDLGPEPDEDIIMNDDGSTTMAKREEFAVVPVQGVNQVNQVNEVNWVGERSLSKRDTSTASYTLCGSSWSTLIYPTTRKAATASTLDTAELVIPPGNLFYDYQFTVPTPGAPQTFCPWTVQPHAARIPNLANQPNTVREYASTSTSLYQPL